MPNRNTYELFHKQPSVTAYDNTPFIDQYGSPPDPTGLGPPTKKRRPMVAEWIHEIIAMIFSIAALLLIILIAALMDEKPLTDWPLDISINAAVSALTVVSRATLAVPIVASISQLKWQYFETPRRVSDMELFDQGSRGGLGSVKLLAKIPKNGAAIGALVTLLAYAMGPMYQQVIRLEERNVELPGNEASAAFSFAHEYNSGVGRAAHGSTINLRTVDTQMQGAMIAGIFGYQIQSNFNCSSICSWPGPFITLGFHHECRNVTVETLQTKKCESDGKEVDDTAENSHNCTLTTPSRIELFSRLSFTSLRTGVYLTGNVTASPLGTGFSVRTPNIFTAAQYSVRGGETGGSQILGEDVQECTVSVAAHKYTGIRAVGNALTIENDDVISSQLAVREDGEELTSEVNITFSAPGIPDLKMHRRDMDVIIGFLSAEYINKTIEVGLSALPQFSISSSLPNLNLSASIADMTERMTQRIADGPNRQIAVGSITQSVIFVNAWFELLSLPIFVTIVTLLLLIFTMWRSRPSTGAVLWKDSALALLYHHASPSDDPRLTGGTLRCEFRDPDSLLRAAKGRVVQKID
ncbi:hypothetical protein OQA88_7694 [Cercophora sp. LCS_1]